MDALSPYRLAGLKKVLAFWKFLARIAPAKASFLSISPGSFNSSPFTISRLYLAIHSHALLIIHHNGMLALSLPQSQHRQTPRKALAPRSEALLTFIPSVHSFTHRFTPPVLT